MRAPGNHLATFRPISFPGLMTERGPDSSLSLSTSGCSTESVSTNNPIYQRLPPNCKHPALLPLLLHITVGWMVGKQKDKQAFLFRPHFSLPLSLSLMNFVWLILYYTIISLGEILTYKDKNCLSKFSPM